MRSKRFLAFVLFFCLLSGIFMFQSAAEAQSSASNDFSRNELLFDGSLIRYADYISEYKATGKTVKIPVDIAAYETDDEGFEMKQIQSNSALVTPAVGEARFRISVEQEDLYAIRVAYFTLEGSGSEAIRSIKIDGKIPFYEASVLKFSRVWSDNIHEKTRDVSGNDILPTQIETPQIQHVYISNSSGLTTDKLYFYLSAGEHILSVAGVREPMALLSMTLETEQQLIPYSAYLQQKTAEGAVIQQQSYMIEAEYASAKSDATIYPLNDRTSPYTSPPSDSHIRYNTIGGAKWQTAGQWLEWDIRVEQDGLYAISMRYSQTLKNNSTVYRKLTIDGEVPFQEAEQLAFEYTSGFCAKTLGSGDDVYFFYFTAGKVHKLRLEAVTGESGQVLETAQQLVNDLNRIYREILMITGPQPDLYRDYDFPALIPKTLDDMAILSEKLSGLEDRIKKISGWKNGSEFASIQRVRRCLDDMVADDTTIAGRFKNFQDSTSSLASWILESKNQPLIIDYFVIGDGSEVKGNSSFFAGIWFQIKQFISSFIVDYSRQGQLGEDQTETVTVWIQTGRDQSQIIRGLINESFTPESHIGVKLQLVAAGSLLPAIIAGRGPDVALQLGQGEPLNYAFRNAVQELSQFDKSGAVRARFSEKSLIPFSYEENLYALPESQSFQMLFYRKDILSDLGIKKSDLATWDSIYKVVIPELQKNYLSFGLLPTFNNFLMMLYQEGGQAYNDDGTASLINSEEGVKTFRKFTKLYTEYLQPVAFDFANRFRTGQIPLAVMDFTAYNQLSVFAPEIAGLWEMVPVPGMVDKEGTMNRGSVLALTACVMFKYSEKQREAFAFLDWWTSADTQIRYGKNMESILGTSARYNSANIQAFQSVAWDPDIRAAIDEQSAGLYAVPEVPGGYYTTRFFDFAYRNVVNDSGDVRTSLNDAVIQIDSEIRNKREEFKLD